MAIKFCLKRVREKQGLTQAQAAYWLKMSLTNYQKVESPNRKSISFELLNRLCDLLACEISDLIVRE